MAARVCRPYPRCCYHLPPTPLSSSHPPPPPPPKIVDRSRLIAMLSSLVSFLSRQHPTLVLLRTRSLIRVCAATTYREAHTPTLFPPRDVSRGPARSLALCSLPLPLTGVPPGHARRAKPRVRVTYRCRCLVCYLYPKKTQCGIMDLHTCLFYLPFLLPFSLIFLFFPFFYPFFLFTFASSLLGSQSALSPSPYTYTPTLYYPALAT
ncbi:uncharacterized protein SCHCODRAFT_02516833 [Schizophyllum commune H4-8]|uniref:uncharacterized protein n=1 Tax=Schizophyllum commune (strain H4-8 / FGSC 9210) TaxID=578458 RepID=UPI00215EEB31|nr:uncharacterized protein SCHCODRAFT_02516833 [Schizophyllum commune H4-8]KAI5886992.1 hypothetical protein SCHCODRAFT_02516833 [Schizophyllum commune H4-8]